MQPPSPWKLLDRKTLVCPKGADMNSLHKHHRASLSHSTVCPQILSHSSLDGIQQPSSLWLAGEEMAYGQSEVTSKGGSIKVWQTPLVSLGTASCCVNQRARGFINLLSEGAWLVRI